jgi:ABC-2 type transporter.
LSFTRGVLGVAVLTSRWIIRQPMWIIQSLMILLGFAILVYVWGRVEGLGYLLSGWVVATGFAIGVNAVGQEVGYHRIMRVLDLIIASPISPRAYILGATLGTAIFALAEIPIVLVMGLLTGYLKLLVFSLIVSIAIMPLGVLLGLIIVFAVKKPMNISAITNPAETLLIFIPPVLYPATIIPEPLRYIALIPPTAAAAQLARMLGGLETAVNPLIPLAIIVIWLALTVILANKVVKWSLD